MRLYTTAPGTVMLTATIKDGAALDSAYMQDFCIEVEALGIQESVQERITLFPNPTTGELRITNYELRVENVEVFDVYGRKLSSNHLITSSSNHKIDISHLQAGIYFVKVITEKGEVVKKVLKQ